MTLSFRLICCAALLFVVSAASAANVAPGVEVVVTANGFSTVFKGITDGKGRFETGPLQPGMYTIEIRVPKSAPPTSARFFLSLAGAKPVGDATIRPGVALAIGAQVRSSAGIRGQVTARGVYYISPPAPAAGGNRPIMTATTAPTPPANATALRTPAPGPNTPAIARLAASPSPIASTRTPVVTRTTATPPPAKSKVPNPQTMVTKRPAGSTATIANVPAPARTVPASSSPATTVANPQSAPVKRPVGYVPKIINGQRYLWVPTTPGSDLGQWVPESVSRPAANAPAANLSPKPSPTPRR